MGTSIVRNDSPLFLTGNGEAVHGFVLTVYLERLLLVFDRRFGARNHTKDGIKSDASV